MRVKSPKLVHKATASIEVLFQKSSLATAEYNYLEVLKLALGFLDAIRERFTLEPSYDFWT